MLTLEPQDNGLRRTSSQEDDIFLRSSNKMTPAKKSVKASSKRRVSFANTVQVRSYNVVQGDHPSCKLLPLSLDWDYSASSRNIIESRVRTSNYELPRRLSLEERRQRLYGNVEDNLADFAQTDNSLDELMKGLDDLLNSVSDVPSLEPSTLLITSNYKDITTNNTCLQFVPRLDDYKPSKNASFSSGLPLSMASYGEFFEGSDLEQLATQQQQQQQQQQQDAPTVHWRRIIC